MTFYRGDLVLYTTPDKKYTFTGIITYAHDYSGDFRVEFPALGRWFENNEMDMSEEMLSRFIRVDDDAVFGTDGIRRNW